MKAPSFNIFEDFFHVNINIIDTNGEKIRKKMILSNFADLFPFNLYGVNEVGKLIILDIKAASLPNMLSRNIIHLELVSV